MANFFFKARFIDAIKAGTKISTIRGRDRRVSIEEGLHLFTGQRFKPVKLGTARAVWVSDITLELEAARIIIPGRTMDGHFVDAFARDEGFADFADMKAFFVQLYGHRGGGRVFHGTLIKWGDTFRPVEGGSP